MLVRSAELGSEKMENSISLSALKEMFAHNYWARDRQLQVCSALIDEQFLRPLGNSFPSVRDTLVHLLAVEWLWLERWRGQSPRVLLSPEEFPTLAVIRVRWQTVEQEMKEYLAALPDEILEQPITCVGTRGNTWTYALWRMMIHLLEHQSYHRGQVTALLRQLGVEPPTVDYLESLNVVFRT
jgi:uncharacterized damage-inducible protein DinB